MGEVLLARQTDLPGIERLVVIKKILPHLANEIDFIERFLAETRVSASLSHGNIVQVYEVGKDGNDYFMVMEYVDGMDLRELLALIRRNQKLLPESLALYILIETAKALTYAHGKRDADGNPMNIVHRDVSPANLLLSKDGQVKLADFGVAKVASAKSFSLPGTLHGKVFYMSPEQVTGSPMDHRSDIFSLGVVAYEMLAGVRPFDGDSDVAVIEKVRNCEPTPLKQSASWVSGALEAIIMRAMHKDPKLRYQSMDAFAQELTSYLLESHTLVNAKSLAVFLAEQTAGLETLVEPSSNASFDEVAALLIASKQDQQNGEAAVDHTLQIAPTKAEEPLSPPARQPKKASIVAGMGVIVAIALGFAAYNGLKPEKVDEALSNDVETLASVSALDGVEKPAISKEQPPESLDEQNSEIPVVTPDEHKGIEADNATESAANITKQAPTVDKQMSTKLASLQPVNGHASKTGSTGVKSTKRRSEITTQKSELGSVKFRFFPSNCDVLLDGVKLELTGNLVDLELESGPHTVELRAADGRRKTQSFLIEPRKVRALGTLELEEL